MEKTATVYQPTSAPFTRLPDLINRLFSESFVMPTTFNDFAGGRATGRSSAPSGPSRSRRSRAAVARRRS